jgi:hypothetical protein
MIKKQPHHTFFMTTYSGFWKWLPGIALVASRKTKSTSFGGRFSERWMLLKKVYQPCQTKPLFLHALQMTLIHFCARTLQLSLLVPAPPILSQLQHNELTILALDLTAQSCSSEQHHKQQMLLATHNILCSTRVGFM